MKTLGLVLALLLASCGGDDDSGLLGIYEINTWTENLDSCAAEGDSIVGVQPETHFYIKQINFFGIDLLTASLCVDLAECRENAGNDDLDLFGLGFDAGSDSSGWTGGGATAGGAPGGECTGEARDFLLEDQGGGSVRLQIETREVAGFPRDSDDFCSTDGARAAAEGQACDRLEVFSGTFVEDI